MSERENSRKFTDIVRQWLAKLLSSHGGGLYAFGYTCSFVYLEVTDLAEDFIALFSDEFNIFSFIIEIVVDSFVNMVESFIWFVPILGYEPPIGIAILVVAFLVFERYFRKPLGVWVTRTYNSDSDDEAPREPADSDQTA